jgi:hypothetical protein
MAKQFEQELQQSGQSILEFEASIASAQPGSTDGEFELDEVLPHLGSEAPATSEDTTARPSAVAAPNFAIKPSSSKSWLPILILVLLAVLAGLYFWFWG